MLTEPNTNDILSDFLKKETQEWLDSTRSSGMKG